MTDAKIRADRSIRLHANNRSNPEAMVEHTEWSEARLGMLRQRRGLRYSDTGDFTRCYRGGF
jgi:hypothetical protein